MCLLVNLEKTISLYRIGKSSDNLDIEYKKCKNIINVRQINKGNQVIGALYWILWQKNVRLKMKKTIIKPVNVYGSKVWKLTKT